jgi:transglutaminase-like putative cysteine protease
MRISISHVSEYSYDGPPAPTVQALRLMPAPVNGQIIESWQITAPGHDTAARYTDGFGNDVMLVAAPGDLAVVRVEASGVIETTDLGGIVGFTSEAVMPAAYLRATGATTLSPGIEAMARGAITETRLSTLHALMQAVHDRVSYVTDSTDAHTTAAAAFEAGEGVCQDHTHIFITAAHALDIPARYITGYLLLDDNTAAPAHHAWAEALVEDIGWVGFDAANNVCPTDRYVRLGAGLDAASAAPIRGIRRGAGHESLVVTVQVTELPQSQSQSQSQS